MVKCDTTGCEGVAIVSKARVPVYCLDCASCKQQLTEHHDQQVDSGDNYVSKCNVSRWDVVGIPDQPYTPQVGKECKFRFKRNIDDPDSEEWSQWFNGEVDYRGEAKTLITSSHEAEGAFWNGLLEFRPLRTERDQLHVECMKAVSAAMNGSSKGQDWGQHSRTINALINAGLIK